MNPFKLYPSIQEIILAIEQGNYQKGWQKYDIKMLKRNLKRLEKQNDIQKASRNGNIKYSLTNKGYLKYLKFKLENIDYPNLGWDHIWRLIAYDIGNLEKGEQEIFRKVLTRIPCLALQKSVYLTPYPCQKEVEKLKGCFDLTDEVLIFEIKHLENESEYKKYFKLR